MASRAWRETAKGRSFDGDKTEDGSQKGVLTSPCPQTARINKTYTAKMNRRKDSEISHHKDMMSVLILLAGS